MSDDGQSMSKEAYSPLFYTEVVLNSHNAKSCQSIMFDSDSVWVHYHQVFTIYTKLGISSGTKFGTSVPYVKTTFTVARWQANLMWFDGSNERIIPAEGAYHSEMVFL